MQNEKLRNVAIIAHVDHGKTTLVDEMLKQGGVYRENQEVVDRVMDSNDLERERGITILAKNTAIRYGDTKINIIDTPGHADFGGEVERILKMVNGVILLVDAAEGPMPQTRFVLSRALELGHRVIVVVNKIDRPDQRIHEVVDEVLELLMDLDATPEQLDSPMLFCSGRNGTASYSPDVAGTDLKPLFDTILEYIPAPEADVDAPFQMLVSAIDYSEYVGRMAIGRIERGTLKQNQEIAVCNYHDPDAAPKKAKAVALYEFEGLAKNPVTESTAGNIICLSGIGDITIGDTICAPDCIEPLPFVKISAPTVEMTFSINDSPFAGREGKFVTSRQLRERLHRETLKDVSLRVTELEGSTDAFNVAGRGEMSLSILIETMRREGYEFQVSPPRVLYQEIDGKKCEPIERLVCDVPQDYVGAVMELCQKKRGIYSDMEVIDDARMNVIYEIPLGEIVFDFFDRLKSCTKGYASLDYELSDYRQSNLVKMDILLNGEVVDALSIIVHRDFAYHRGNQMTQKLKELIPKHQFEIPVQAAIGGKVIARTNIKSLRKNVLAKCYGGDISRKKKLLEKQKEGKKRMKAVGSVEIPQEAFMAVLSMDDE